MSEYIGEYVVSLTAKTFTDLRSHRHEQIVRCRDCKHYDHMNDDEGMCMVPDDDGDYARWMVDDVGYCYLGERRG